MCGMIGYDPRYINVICGLFLITSHRVRKWLCKAVGRKLGSLNEMKGAVSKSKF